MGSKILLLLLLPLLSLSQWIPLDPGSPEILSTDPNAHPAPAQRAPLWYVERQDLYLLSESHMWKYEVDDKRWLWMPPVNLTPREGASYWSIQSNLYLSGGTNDAGTLLSDSWVYTVNQRQFSPLPAAPKPCTNAAFWKHETTNKLYQWGGRCGPENRTTDELYSFDVNLKQWQLIPTQGEKKPLANEKVSATVKDDTAYLYSQDQLWALDLTTFTWSQSAGRSPPGPDRFNHILWMNHAGQVALYGGQSGSRLYVDTWVYSPKDGQWNLVDDGNGPLPTALGAGSCSDLEGNLYYYGPEKGQVWEYGKFTVHTILEMIEWKLDSATLAATVAAIMSSFLFFGLLFLAIISCIRKCRKARLQRGPLSMAVLRRDNEESEAIL